MNSLKANEVIDMSENVEVLYKGTSVWIEHIKEDSNTAIVKVLETLENIEVPLEDLYETGRELK
ncbi:H-type small acid-soluble spore protein [Dethiothermospora halolimnae]|uniref:H-type small acid-soluble spore protein n=1 Tax=Dethiothermospora halolimnae TaxID=3114390 RepID=UPI003CCC1D33